VIPERPSMLLFPKKLSVQRVLPARSIHDDYVVGLQAADDGRNHCGTHTAEAHSQKCARQGVLNDHAPFHAGQQVGEDDGEEAARGRKHPNYRAGRKAQDKTRE
jgi:hypothetical protein